MTIDLQKVIAQSKGRYGKKQKALADDITTGDQIVLSDSDDAYIIHPELDFWKLLTGIKGAPYGRIIQIAGKADSGKSSLAMLFMKATQESGGSVILWDAEKKFSSKRFQDRMGADPSQLLVSRSKNITEGAKQVVSLLRGIKDQDPKHKVLIVWDSVGASMNSAEDDDDDDFSKQPGVTAREVSWAIKKLNKAVERWRDLETGDETVAVCCVNQVYANIGSVGHKEKGGGELEYLSSLILQLSRIKDLNKQRDGEKYKYGIVTRAKVKKNHLFDGEDTIAELQLVVSASGISKFSEVKKKSKEIGLVEEEEDDA